MNLRRSAVLALIVCALVGCGGSFESETEELAYLSSLSNPSPTQWKRKNYLAEKLVYEREFSRLKSLYEDARSAMKRREWTHSHYALAEVIEGCDELLPGQGEFIPQDQLESLNRRAQEDLALAATEELSEDWLDLKAFVGNSANEEVLSRLTSLDSTIEDFASIYPLATAEQLQRVATTQKEIQVWQKEGKIRLNKVREALAEREEWASLTLEERITRLEDNAVRASVRQALAFKQDDLSIVLSVSDRRNQQLDQYLKTAHRYDGSNVDLACYWYAMVVMIDPKSNQARTAIERLKILQDQHEEAEQVSEETEPVLAALSGTFCIRMTSAVARWACCSGATSILA